MDGASQKISIGAEETACMGMVVGKGAIAKDLPFVFIDAGNKLRTGGYRFACKLIWPDLLIDDDIIAQGHAAGSAFPAGKRHVHSLSHHLKISVIPEAII